MNILSNSIEILLLLLIYIQDIHYYIQTHIINKLKLYYYYYLRLIYALNHLNLKEITKKYWALHYYLDTTKWLNKIKLFTYPHLNDGKIICMSCLYWIKKSIQSVEFILHTLSNIHCHGLLYLRLENILKSFYSQFYQIVNHTLGTYYV